MGQGIKTYRETLFNRLRNPQVGVRINIGQRVAENDLSGYIKSNNQNGKYFNIVLPIEVTEDIEPKELTSNYKNGVLWYDRFPVESFADLTDSTYVFATQYLQRPAPRAGE